MIHRWQIVATAGLAAVALVGCGGGNAGQDDQRDVSLAPAESVAALNDQPQPTAAPQQGAQTQTARTPSNPTPTRTQPAPRPPARVLPAGTVVELAARDTVSSRSNKPGDPIVATASADVTDAQGRVLIPAGSEFSGVIEDIKPAPNPGSPGTLVLAFNQVTVNGHAFSMAARTDTVGAETQGRGITGGDAAKVGIGAAAGAIAGRVLGGDTKGAVVGGVVGAAAGAGIAAATKDRDIVLPAGGLIRLVLQAPMSLESK